MKKVITDQGQGDEPTSTTPLKSKGKGRGKRKNKKRAKEILPLWLELPEEIWPNILQRLEIVEILLTAQKVCTTWRRACKDPSVWRVINMPIGSQYFNFDKRHTYEEMCRHAVDHSQGELVDISLAFYATNKLLAYITERSGKLKRLSISWNYSKLSLVQVVQKLSLLAELSLTEIVITREGIEALGSYCP
ncbi:putative F-box/LRR-repeat protein 23 [Lycium barbarum]|uniref:putative F-box/LRR-repeat protein 23 n=1 Tax=Lycium barbarum TaxID=112863 RepID=UPI00293F71FD|nr:putative F-box/LRR-repeat protein 23 [Lycium barbarum]